MIAINALSQTAALGIGLVAQTVYIVLVARFLPISEFGQFSLVFAISQILFLGGDLGIHNTALRRIAVDRHRSLQTFQRFLFLKIILAVIILVTAGIIASVFLSQRGPALELCMLLFGVGLFFQSLGMTFNIVYQAHNKLYLASLNVLTGVILHALIGTLGLFLGGSLVSLGVASAAAQAITLALNLHLFRRTIHPIPRPCATGSYELAVSAIPVGLGTLLETLTSRLGIVLVTYLAGETVTGIFSASIRITGAMRNLPLAIFSAVLPVLAATTGDPVAVRRVFLRYLKVALLLAGFAVPVLWLGSDLLISLLYTDAFAESVPVLRILILSLPAVFLSGGLTHLLLSQKHLVPRHPWIAGVGTLGSVLFYLLFVPRGGAVGAAWAQFWAEVVVVVAYLIGLSDFLLGRSKHERE